MSNDSMLPVSLANSSVLMFLLLIKAYSILLRCRNLFGFSLLCVVLMLYLYFFFYTNLSIFYVQFVR